MWAEKITIGQLRSLLPGPKDFKGRCQFREPTPPLKTP